MNLTIRLLASYRQYLPEERGNDSSYPLDVPRGARVDEVLPRLPIPHGDAYTFFVNGRHAVHDQVLADGDVLTVFPAVGGG
ncbi:MAG TPA: MoaD/ThiS family protein [Anaerolineae bacterium]|nr:MoaD/ThiS family protein [Anaerolineae bacterium]